MGMFDFLKKKGNNAIVIAAPIEGEVVISSEIPDPVFSEEMMGQGVAIKPAVGKVFSPVDGTVAMVFDTKHAINIISDEGCQVLIHVGLDTVKLGGKHFDAHVKDGDRIHKGDKLITFDKEAVIKAGYDVTTPMVVCNSEDYNTIRIVVNDVVSAGEKAIVINGKGREE
jgi:PTS system beta-glucosides-specific IIC component